MSEDRFLYFITICEEENLTKAAEKLYISQPSLTKYINGLEKELGTRLLDRSTVPIKTTEAGELYLQYARDMLDRYNKLKKSIDELNLRDRNIIVFGISSNLSKYYLSDVIKIARQINPDFNFRIVEETSYNMENLIKKGEINAAFLTTDNLVSRDIQYNVIGEDRICLVCSKNNPALKNRPFVVQNGIKEYIFKEEEIEGLSFYTRNEDFQITKVINKFLDMKGLEIKDDIRVADLNTMIYLLCDTDRFAFIPQIFLNESEFRSKLAISTIENNEIKWYMTFGYSQKAKIDKDVRKWIEKVKEFYRYKF